MDGCDPKRPVGGLHLHRRQSLGTGARPGDDRPAGGDSDPAHPGPRAVLLVGQDIDDGAQQRPVARRHLLQGDHIGSLGADISLQLGQVVDAVQHVLLINAERRGPRQFRSDRGPAHRTHCRQNGQDRQCAHPPGPAPQGQPSQRDQHNRRPDHGKAIACLQPGAGKAQRQNAQQNCRHTPVENPYHLPCSSYALAR